MNAPLELVFGIALAAAAVYFVLRPILSPRSPGAESAPTVDEADDGEEPGDDLSPRSVALRALKEIEIDRATGKLRESDYDVLKRQYTAEALVALRAEAAPPPVGDPRPSDPGVVLACPIHGPRPEGEGGEALFCSECGRRLGRGTGAGYCPRCGTVLEGSARFCARCGKRVPASRPRGGAPPSPAP